MKRALKKLHSRRGETLVETLAAILICVMAVTLLGTMVSATFNINQVAAAATERYQTELKAAELQTLGDTVSGSALVGAESVQIYASGSGINTGSQFSVNWFGDDSGTLRSFKAN